LQYELRKAALGYDAGDVLPRIRKQDIRAEAADERLEFFVAVAGDMKQAGLLQLHEEQRRVFVLGLGGDCQHDFVERVADLGVGAAQVEVGLRRPVRAGEYLR